MSEMEQAAASGGSGRSGGGRALAGARSGGKTAVRRLFGAQESGLLLVILLMMTGLTIFGGSKTINVIDPATGSVLRDESGQLVKREVNKFLEPRNLVLVAKNASFFAIMAVGMTGVIILAGIDLSVGSIYALAAMVGAMVLTRLPADASALVAIPVGLGVCCAVGALCGAANGGMVVGLRVHPFVITLGMMAALRGLAFILPKKIDQTQSVGGFPSSFTSGFVKAEIFGVHPVPVVFMVLVGVIGMFALSQTVFGRRVYAIGGNETAARYAGVPVGAVKVVVYMLTGLLAGLSAALYIGYDGAAVTNAGMAYELQVIAAAVIGGASLMGGRGTAIGAVLGAIVIQLIDNGMLVLEIDQEWNQVVMGAAIIIAVVVDQAKARLSVRR